MKQFERREKFDWHAMEPEEILDELESDSEHGLSEEEARRRIQDVGPNQLEAEEGTSILKLALEQLKSPLIYLLVAAALVSLVAGKHLDAGIIALVVVLNTFLGVFQEHRAEKSLEALRKLSSPKARVLRDGETRTIQSRDVVPGDVLMLESGDTVAADARLFRAKELFVDESALTGESEPVSKDVGRVKEDTPLSDRKNMVFFSTPVTGGRGRAVVVATGMHSAIGEIAGEMREVERQKTPLQKRLSKLSIYIGILALFLAAIVFLLGFIKGYDLVEIFLYSVAVAVSSIPEGLPAVISITLAMGVRRMSERNAILRRLPAVETLGSTTVVCSDKTGTITKNEMTVTRVWAGGRLHEITGLGYRPVGEVKLVDSGNETRENQALNMLMRIGVLANDSDISEKDGHWSVDGLPTEGALLVASVKYGIDWRNMRRKHPRKDEIPFSSEKKYMAAVHDPGEGDMLMVKGAPDRVLGFCSHWQVNGERRRMDDDAKRRIHEMNKELAGEGLRVMAGAFKESPGSLTEKEAESGLTFLGLWGIVDPPRAEAVDAIDAAHRAGIRTIMITGDHAFTGRAIATQVGISCRNDHVLSGHDLDRLTDEVLGERVREVSVYARVSPSHKQRILKALQDQGEVVAMTGDGVNDAPALKSANIGVAMGKAGTEVAREAADMVLTDDNFATIIAAVEEGRVIFSNLRRVLFFLLTTNIGEVITLVTALLIGLPLPLTALMIIWINLLTDGVCVVPLGLEPNHAKVLDQPPRSSEQGIVDMFMIKRIVMLAPIMALGTLGLFWWNLDDGHAYAQTIAFTTLAAFQWFQALNARSRHESLFSIGPFTNKWLLLGIGTAVVLQLATVYFPPLQSAFGTEPLSPWDWLACLGVASAIFVADEIYKLLGVHGKLEKMKGKTSVHPKCE